MAEEIEGLDTPEEAGRKTAPTPGQPAWYWSRPNEPNTGPSSGEVIIQRQTSPPPAPLAEVRMSDHQAQTATSGARYVRTSTQSTVTPRRGVAQWRRPGTETRRQPSGPPNPSFAVPSVLLRLSAVAFVLATLWYLPWMVVSIRHDDAWLTMPLLGANLLTAGSMLLAIFNNWSRRAPRPNHVRAETRPSVAVLIPTCGEPPSMVALTIESVLDQNWPQDRLVIIVGDDAHSDEMAEAVYDVAERFPASSIIYHEPPRRGDARRRGDAKAGNLNSCYELLKAGYDVDWVETRDADDAVGSPDFLNNCLGQLTADDDLAFVQTIKTARVSGGDPFDNNFIAFYRGNMFARHAANAVFPCGSGLVWRREALDDVGGFPDWNLVEDLQSGVNALRRGWRGAYIPIVGVVSQHAPEDIPNVYKQRGTWALDTIRLLLWGNFRGLGIRQYLQFLEPGLYYLQCFGTIALIYATLVTLFFHIHPLISSQAEYWIHLLPFVAALELLLVMLAGGGSARAGWRMRVMLMGLFPVFTKASVLALVYGPKRKPTYKVTRKEDEFALYWRETMIQSGCVLALVASIIYSFTESPKHFTIDAGAIYWAFFFSLLLAGFVRKSWFGISLLPRRGQTDRGAAHDSGGAGQRPREWSEESSSPIVTPSGPQHRRPGRILVLSAPGRRAKHRRPGASRTSSRFGTRSRTLEPAPRLVARSTWTSHFS